MATFRNVQRQYPEYWITRTGAVTGRRAMLYYNLRDERSATLMLDALVRQRRLIKREIDGQTVWDVPRR